MSKFKKLIEEVKDVNNAELDLVDRGIARLDDVPGLCKENERLKTYGLHPENSYIIYVYF